MHTYILTYTRTYTHAYIPKCLHSFIHTCIHTCIHTFIRTFTHTYIQLDIAYGLASAITTFEPFIALRMRTISKFVFNGNSWPVRLIKYFQVFDLSRSSLMHERSASTTENLIIQTVVRLMFTWFRDMVLMIAVLNISTNIVFSSLHVSILWRREILCSHLLCGHKSARLTPM